MGTSIPTAGGGGGSGFGTPFTIDQLNSVGANVQTWEFQNQLLVNTSGSETANMLITVPVNGAQVSLDLASLNARGRQTASTNAATPTVALSPRADILVISIGADTTSLTITGTDLDTDFEYEVSLDPYVGATTPSAITCDLNGSTSTYVGLAFAAHGTGSGSILSRIQLADTDLTGTVGMAKVNVRKTPGKAATWNGQNFTTEGGGTFLEFVQGNSNITANVTSLVLNGNIGNGSVVVLKRNRCTVL